MNCYDFDKTIYDGDSSVDFYLFCLKQNKKLLRHLPKQAWAFFLHYGLHKISKTKMKQIFYEYFADVPVIEEAVLSFWEQNEHKIFAYYLNQKDKDDVIISASPEFLLAPICKHLGISHIIASQVDPETGHYTGENCYGKEKVRRFREEFPYGWIDDFYSDSLSDSPMAQEAEHAFLIQKGIITPWHN